MRYKPLIIIAFTASLAFMAGGCSGDEINVISEIIEQGEEPPPIQIEPTEPTDPELSWSADSMIVVYGSEYVFPTLSNPNNVSVEYSSTDEDVATISQTGEVSIIASGAATIIATSPGNDNYTAGSVSYNLTVTKADAGLEWSEESCSAVYGKEVALPILINPNRLEISWFSSDERVATVSGEGEVTIVGAGVTVISANSSETAGYVAGSASFTLSVGKNKCEVAWLQASCDTKIGEENVFPSLDNPAGQEISYSSSDETVASVSPDGVVILHSPGSVTITATAIENDTHVGGSAFYTLNVDARDVRLQNPDLSWAVDRFEISYFSSEEFPALSNPNNLNVTYSSSSPEVANVFSNGDITVKGIGTTTITASSKANDTFAAGSVSYILSIVKSIPDLSWTEENREVTIGADNSFPTLDNPSGLVISYSSSNPSVATISSDGVISLNSSGTTTIMAMTESTDYYQAANATYTLEVNKAEPPLRWSSGTCEAFIGSDNIFPTLENPLGLNIVYSSSNPSVASVGEDGTVTIKAGGIVTINAISKETEDFSTHLVSYKLTVRKIQVTLSWSASECSATLDEGNSFPSLNNPADVNITYSSSNPSVASISSGGEIAIVGQGTTTITARFAGDDIHESAATSYTLKVSRGNFDEGAGSFTFTSTGDPSSDDDISNTTFDRMITITFQEGGSANVTGDYYDYVSVNGNKVTVRNTGNDEYVIYKLTGSTSNGYFKLYSERKQAVLLSGVSITSQEGAAIDNQSDKRTYIVVEGTNTLSDMSSSSYKSGEEDMKAVLFSEGQLVFSGTGSLTVNAVNKFGKNAIASDDYIRFMSSPTVRATSQREAGNGIKANEHIQISSGKLVVSIAADTEKGISSDDYVLVEGGETSITVTGGVARDGNEHKGSAGIKADNYFAMTGGTVNITNRGDGGKGIRAEMGESLISGGTLTINTSGSTAYDVAPKGIKIGNEDVVNNYGDLRITGGKIDVTTKTGEALEVKGELTISGGEHCFESNYDDAINCHNGIHITDGFISAISKGNDAIDSNSDLRISGGMVYAICMKGPPEGSLDAMLEKGNRVYIEDGATLVAFGGIEPGAVLNQPTYKMDVKPRGTNTLLDENGNTLAVFKAPETARIMIVSAPGLTTGRLGVSVSGGSSRCHGYLLFPSLISGGEEALLTPYVPESIWEKLNTR